MNFKKIFFKNLSEFLKEKVEPYFMKWDEEEQFPKELLEEMAGRGCLNALIPKKIHCGTELNYFEYVKFIEEVSKVDSSLGLSLAAHNSLCSNHIFSFGNENQKNKYLFQLASGKFLGAWAITETQAGSDVKNMQTTAIRQGDHWILNGKKTFITHALSAEVFVVIAKNKDLDLSTNESPQGGFSAFIVEKGQKGFLGGKKFDKLGMRASETGELIFENCEIPDSQLLGNIGEGFDQAMKILDGGRISIAALSLGIAKGAYKEALDHAKKRIQFGRPIAKFQAISSKIAHMATEIAAAELLIYKACQKKEEGLPYTLESAMCKYYASEVAVKASSESLQILGGYGYLRGSKVEKFYRDAKLCTLGEGTSEIQKLVISKELLRDESLAGPKN